jgi:excisionase family DNA binding protein
MTEELFVPIEAVAKHFSVSVSTVRAWLRQDLIPSLKVGGVYRFRLSEVEAGLRSLSGGDLVRETADGMLVTTPKEGDPQLPLNFNLDDDI